MKKIFTILAILMFSSIVFAQKAGDKFPLSASDYYDNPMGTEIFRENKITMVNIWATYCSPCINEMPDLTRIENAYSSKGVAVVGLAYDVWDEETRKTFESILDKTEAYYLQLIPNYKDYAMYGLLSGLTGVPTTFFVDRYGRQIGEPYVGSNSYKEWASIIDKLLAQQY